MLRQQLPVYSPLSLRALAGGVADLVRPGDAHAELERVLAARFRADRAILCGSGTQALQLALEVGRTMVGPDAAVALPAFACFDVATAAAGAGVAVVLYDLDPATLSPDLASLERACEAGAGIIVAVHLYGLPVDWDALSGCAARYGALLIEDAAQGHGAAWRHRPLGSLAPLSVLSFGRGKGWTGGAGGALLLRGTEVDVLRDLPAPSPGAAARELVTALAQWLIGRPTIYGMPASLPWLGLGETHYHRPSPVHGMTGLAAALLLRLDGVAREHAAGRRAAGDVWAAAFAGSASVRPIAPHPAATPGYLRFPLRVPRGVGSLVWKEARRLGIAPSYPCPLSKLPELGPLLRTGDRAGLPGADELSKTLMTLPTHHFVSGPEQAATVSLLSPANAAGSRTFSLAIS